MIAKTFYILHGFNVADRGKSTTDRFIQPLRDRGHVAIDLDYGWTGLAGVRLFDRKAGGLIAKMAKPGSILIGHSNGCAIASFAVDMGAAVDGLIFINPALNQHWKPNVQVKWMHVYYNARDYATFIAAALPGHRWGAMGHLGPGYEDPRVKAIDTGQLGSYGHSAIFKNFQFYGDAIIDMAEAEHQ